MKYVQLYKGRTGWSQLGHVLPQRAVGSFLASCGLVGRGQAGPTGSQLKKELSGVDGDQAETQGPPRRQPATPWLSSPHLLPQSLAPQRRAGAGSQQEGTLRPGTLWHLPFSYPLDNSEHPKNKWPHRQGGSKNNTTGHHRHSDLCTPKCLYCCLTVLTKDMSVTLPPPQGTTQGWLLLSPPHSPGHLPQPRAGETPGGGHLPALMETGSLFSC